MVTGQRFDRPLKDLPSEFFLKPIFKVAKALNPSSTYQLAPYPAFLTNLIQTAQVKPYVSKDFQSCVGGGNGSAWNGTAAGRNERGLATHG